MASETNNNSRNDRIASFYNDLLHQTPSDQLRPISNTGEVTLKPTCYYCSYCRCHMGPTALHHCRLCQSTVYCTVTCQSAHWKQQGGHRSVCQEIRRCRKTVRELSTEYRDSNGIMDVFDRDNDIVFYFASRRGLGSIGKNYMNHRMDLLKAYLSMHNDPHGWHLALEHSLELLHLDPIQAEGSVRTTLAHCLFSLGRYQELYEFVKYWNLLPQKLRAIHTDTTIVDESLKENLRQWMGPNTFLNFQRQQFMFEHQSHLALRPPCKNPSISIPRLAFPPPTQSEVISVLYLALAKLRIFQSITGLQHLLAHRLPIESDLIVCKIGAFLGLKAEWINTGTNIMLQQVHELLAFANESIPGILTTILDAPNPPTASDYTDDQTIPVFELFKTALEQSKFTDRFWQDYEHLYSKNPPVDIIPRKPILLQQFFQPLYEQYLYQTSDQFGRILIKEHWNRTKDTPPAQELLLETMTHGQELYQHETDFSIGRILVALRNENQVLEAEFVLGYFDESMELVDREIFLAGEHYLQVRNHIRVQDFRKRHDIQISPAQEEQCNSLHEVCELVTALFRQLLSKALAQEESHLKLLFGNEGWVAPLFCRDLSED